MNLLLAKSNGIDAKKFENRRKGIALILRKTERFAEKAECIRVRIYGAKS